jgi:hypothetical protein
MSAHWTLALTSIAVIAGLALQGEFLAPERSKFLLRLLRAVCWRSNTSFRWLIFR